MLPRSLSGQFALVGGLIMLIAMTLAGTFISGVVARSTVENTAASTALFMESLLSPLVQELASRDALPDGRASALDALLGMEPFRQRFPYVEIWKEGGLVAYSTTPELVGQRFAPPDGLLSALRGKIAAQYTDLKAREHVVRDISKRYLEIYVPVREHLSGRIIAVAEIHEVTAPLERRLRTLRLQSWIAVGAASLLVMLALFGVVRRGSVLIDRQKAALVQRIGEVEEVSRQNRELRERAQRASSRIADANERYLRHLGAELHDGPAQLLGLAALKVDHVRRAQSGATREKELEAMSSILADAIQDVRAVSKGLMLPDIEHLPLPQVLDRVVRVHERRTGSKVDVRWRGAERQLSHAVKTCVYRFIQEGLNNAFNHAGGAGQRVDCTLEDTVLAVAVEDSGGTGAVRHDDRQGGLGLAGLRERVERLGGTFAICRAPRGGTRIEMSLDLSLEMEDA